MGGAGDGAGRGDEGGDAGDGGRSGDGGDVAGDVVVGDKGEKGDNAPGDDGGEAGDEGGRWGSHSTLVSVVLSTVYTMGKGDVDAQQRLPAPFAVLDVVRMPHEGTGRSSPRAAYRAYETETKGVATTSGEPPSTVVCSITTSIPSAWGGTTKHVSNVHGVGKDTCTGASSTSFAGSCTTTRIHTRAPS